MNELLGSAAVCLEDSIFEIYIQAKQSTRGQELAGFLKRCHSEPAGQGARLCTRRQWQLQFIWGKVESFLLETLSTKSDSRRAKLKWSRGGNHTDGRLLSIDKELLRLRK
jgi:hypothetical protein